MRTDPRPFKGSLENADFAMSRDDAFTEWDTISNDQDGSERSASASFRSQSSNPFDEDPALPYSMDDLKLIVESEDSQQIWTETITLFTKSSTPFANLVAQDLGRVVLPNDPITQLPGLQRHPDRQPKKGLRERLKYKLKGVTPFDLDSLLLGLKPALGQEIPFERLCPLLVLATDWGFESLRAYAIECLSKQEDLPVPRILLARRARVSEWFLEPYVELATRLEPLSAYETRVLGRESVLAISKSREKVLERRLSLVAGPRPNMLFGKWFLLHPACWITLSDAWNSALKEPKYHGKGMTPIKAIIASLRDHCSAGRRGLCRGCRPSHGIELWLNLVADERVARSVLKEHLGSELEEQAADG